MSLSGLAAAAVVVYDDYAASSLLLSDQSMTYSGSADFDIDLSARSSEFPYNTCYIRALSHYGPSTMNTSGVCFQTIALTGAEHITPRIAQADAVWEFTVADSDTTFSMFALRELGTYSWALMDLTLDSLIATAACSGGMGGNVLEGSLLLGHSYRLTESVRTGLTSDELAQLDFGVGTDVIFALQPELDLQLPGGEAVANGGSWDGGACIIGEPQAFSFTIRNTGAQVLSGLAASVEGANATDFLVNLPAGISIPPRGSVVFNLTVAPTTGGTKSATLRITSNDTDENPYLVQLSALALSATNDADGDGMSDAGEFKLRSLGFDWQVAQPEMVTAYFAAATTNGLYTKSQVQAMHVGSPLLVRDPVTGMFTLTLGLHQSTDLLHYEPMPMSATNATIDGDGRLELRFPPSGNAAFFRLSAQ
ncbi:MAG: hypothetical protein WCL39_14300 [Armatimonadota bacterium]